MKTNKLKNYIKLGIVLFSISLLFTNCQNELEEKNEIQNNEQKHKIELHSKSQIANNVNVISKIKKLNTNIKNKKETKSVYSDLYDFTIETDYALYAEFEDGTYSYTFPISRETSIDGIENFVLTLTLDGNLRAQYFKYDLTHEEYLNYGTDPNLLDKVTIITVEDNDLILEVNQTKYSGNGDSGSDWSWDFLYSYWGTDTHDGLRRHELINVWGWVYHGDNLTDPCWNCDAGAGADDDGYNPSYEGGASSGNNSTVTTPFSFVELQFLIDLGNALGGSGSAFGGLTSEQNAWVTDNINNYQQAQKIRDFLNLNPNSQEAQNFANELLSAMSQDTTADNNALQFVLTAYNQNKINYSFDSDFLNSVNQFMTIDAANDFINPTLSLEIQIYFETKIAVLRHNHPDWSNTKLYWEASKDIVHIGLDVFGLIPVVGEVADLANGVLYTIEGDGVNATLSYASAVPIAGWAAVTTKYAVKVVEVYSIGTKARLTWKVLGNGVIYFGSSGSKLRKVLGITDSAMHAHHLIPWARRNNALVQKAAKSADAFHINEAINGIPRLSNLHLTGHGTYDTVVKNILENPAYQNLSIDESYNFIKGLSDHIRGLINANPSMNSGQIANLISYP